MVNLEMVHAFDILQNLAIGMVRRVIHYAALTIVLDAVCAITVHAHAIKHIVALHASYECAQEIKLWVNVVDMVNVVLSTIQLLGVIVP